MSVAELLVGAAMSLLLLAFLYQTFLSQHRSWAVQQSTAELQEGMRTALDLICRELRMAGYDPTGLAGAGLEACGEDRVRFTADRNGNGQIDAGDQERITYWLEGDELSLRRTLYEGTASASTQELLEGVEALGFAYAYDADGDGAIDGPFAVDTDGDGDLDLDLDTNGDGVADHVVLGPDLARPPYNFADGTWHLWAPDLDNETVFEHGAYTGGISYTPHETDKTFAYIRNQFATADVLAVTVFVATDTTTAGDGITACVDDVEVNGIVYDFEAQGGLVAGIKDQIADAQAECDLSGAVNVLKAALVEESPENPIELDLPSGKVTIRWTDESGKFNLNVLRTEETALAASRLEKLFRILEEESKVHVLGLAGEITDFVLSSERPLFSLGELTQVEGITREVLEGGEEGGGLADYITVYSDGKIRPESAPDEVLSCLDEGVTGQASVEQLRALLADPKAKASGPVRAALRRMAGLFTETLGAWKAVVSLEGPFCSREVEVALRRAGEGAIQVVLYNERESDSERFRR